MKLRILIVEDDADIAEVVRYNLEREGFEPFVALTGERALSAALNEKNLPELIILDLMLPGMSGMELCRRLRREPLTRSTPIIMLTAKSSETDKIAGLEIGADDYITKPFSVRELIARIHAIFRRANVSTAFFYEDACLKIEYKNMRVRCGGEELKLTRKEFGLLTRLSRSANRVATRQMLLDDVWGREYYGDMRTLDVHIRRLRQKLGACDKSIETVIGIGYRFVGCSDHQA
jgi:DNA-binding response OmpR family regulator